ncbi:hypothetical protein CEXT_806051 [Caerostris extrusa]|uniref:Uncharacterized protein n=1 Tax=Caerostris extrusa TaxID=172846 RepID=A0AAV4X8A2_CAEEX|nr:hypothetical protein CEXT_806051 [Caerostris extrusa]
MLFENWRILECMRTHYEEAYIAAMWYRPQNIKPHLIGRSDGRAGEIWSRARLCLPRVTVPEACPFLPSILVACVSRRQQSR